MTRKAPKKIKQALETGGIGGIGMKVLLNEIPDHARHKHHVDERRNERKQNLEDEDVRQRYETERALPRENAFMFENRLQNSERPAEALPHERVGARRRLREG